MVQFPSQLWSIEASEKSQNYQAKFSIRYSFNKIHS